MTSKQHSRGFTLIEVLVALVLLSIGLLGLAKLQFWGVKHTGSAYFRTQATQLANEMVERMRSNPMAVVDLEYSAGRGACKSVDCPKQPTDCRATPCNQMAQNDLYAVACGLNGKGDHQGIDDLLPQGGLEVSCTQNGSTSCIVEVCWQESDDVKADSVAEGRFVRMTVVP